MEKLLSLNYLEHGLIAPSLYPKRVRNLRGISLDTVNLERPYISDQLDYEMKLWSCKNPIVIGAPTGSGKTTFVVEKIVRRAKKTSENVLIITNRNPLNVAYKKEVAKVMGMENYYGDLCSSNVTDFSNIYVVNYQGLENFMKNHSSIIFDFVVADECHYFLQDAMFSDCTDFVLESIPKKFRYAVRIYISATIEEVLPHIIRVENPFTYVDDFGNLVYLNQAYGTFVDANQHLPRVYEMSPDYSQLELVFYENTQEIIEYFETREDKALVFLNSIEQCKFFKKNLSSSLVVYSKYLKENPELLNKLIEEERFDEKIMLTTSVFSNGNNIKDQKVKSVAIEAIDIVDIKQMAGRRRINNDNLSDSFTVYIKIPDLEFLEKKFREINHKLNLIENCRTNPNLVLYHMKDYESEDSNFIRKIFGIDDKEREYRLNELAFDKLYYLRSYINYIHALIEEKGPEAYCELIAKQFGKNFENKMFFKTNEERKKELVDFIYSFKFPMNEEEFTEFSDVLFDKRIELFGKHPSDNLSKKRTPQKEGAINSRLSYYEINLKIVKKDGLYYIENIDEELSLHDGYEE